MGKLKDLTGMVFGELTILYLDKERMAKNKIKNNSRITFWCCQCSCGRIASIDASSLKSGNSKSCGCSKIKNQYNNPNKVLTELPRNGNGVLWERLIDKEVEFLYNNEIIKIKVLDVMCNKNRIYTLKCMYKNTIANISAYSFKNAKLGNITDKKRDYFYKVGDVVKTKLGRVTITKHTTLLINNSKIKAYEYKCLNCNDVNTVLCNVIQVDYRCPFCEKQKIIKGSNDIYTTHNWMVKYFKNNEDAYKYSFGSNVKIQMICPHCGTEKMQKIYQLITHGFSCLQCGDGISKPQKIIFFY